MALALPQAGYTATVYEQAPALRAVGAGISLWPNATGVLQQFGLLDTVASKSAPLSDSVVKSQQGDTLLQSEISSDSPPR